MLAIAAAFADGETVIHDAAELAVKESNRIGTVEQELTQLGIPRRGPDRRLGHPGGAPAGADLKSHGDHRIAMAAAVAGLGRDRRDDRARLRRDGGVVPGLRRRPRVGARVSVRSTTAGVVAIDGPSGSGKSTIGRGVATALGLETLDTGAMYRAVTLAVLRAGLDPTDGDAAAARGAARRRSRWTTV